MEEQRRCRLLRTVMLRGEVCHQSNLSEGVLTYELLFNSLFAWAKVGQPGWALGGSAINHYKWMEAGTWRWTNSGNGGNRTNATRCAGTNKHARFTIFTFYPGQHFTAVVSSCCGSSLRLWSFYCSSRCCETLPKVVQVFWGRRGKEEAEGHLYLRRCQTSVKERRPVRIRAVVPSGDAW